MIKNWAIKLGVLFFVFFVLFGCASVTPEPPNVPTQAQLEQIAKADTFVGTITGGNFAKGVGFSNINIKLEVTSDNGDKATFYVRSDSIVVDASGKYLNYLEAKRGKGKKVEIKYFTITDGTGGDPSRSDFSYQIGQKGVRLMRFLDWKSAK